MPRFRILGNSIWILYLVEYTHEKHTTDRLLPTWIKASVKKVAC
jgi:hypothetical protein